MCHVTMIRLSIWKKGERLSMNILIIYLNWNEDIFERWDYAELLSCCFILKKKKKKRAFLSW